MAVDTPATIAILGGGPIGIEAALYARYLGYGVELFEACDEIAGAAARWGHLPMGTPFVENSSPLGIAMLRNQFPDRELPADEALLTGNQWREQYLIPLSQTDLLADSIHCGVRVEAIGKVEIGKSDSPSGEFDRGSWDFRLLVSSGGKERLVTADLVFDCTGTFHDPLPLGGGGIPAIGERAVRDSLHYGIVPPERAGGNVLLIVGDDPLAAFAAAQRWAKIIWLTPHERTAAGPLSVHPAMSAPLRERVTAAAAAALSGEIEWHAGVWVESIERNGNRFRVEYAGETAGFTECDEIAVCNGFRGDFRPAAELRLEFEAETEAPRCDERGVIASEPNYYVFGAKRYGRRRGYVHALGLEQIREAFKVIGDREGLDLYRDRPRTKNR